MAGERYPRVSGYDFIGMFPREAEGVGKAEVWEATTSDGAGVAFKIDGSRGEAELLATLQHPSIAPVLDRGTTEDGRGYFAMPLYRDTLSNFMRWPDDPGRVLPLLVPVLEALEYLHGCGIAHGDVKLANVCLGEAGPVLIDFESAVRVAQPQPMVEPERRWTWWVCPPEVLAGNVTTATVATDIYSAGALAYHLLRWGPVAPLGAERTELLKAHSAKRKPPLPQRAAH